jgi:hypothetical protein
MACRICRGHQGLPSRAQQQCFELCHLTTRRYAAIFFLWLFDFWPLRLQQHLIMLQAKQRMQRWRANQIRLTNHLIQDIRVRSNISCCSTNCAGFSNKAMLHCKMESISAHYISLKKHFSGRN